MLRTLDVEEATGATLTAPDIACTWPAWSPDGASLAYSGFRSGGNGLGHLGVYVRRLEETEARLVYANEPGTDAIAPRTPHYALWSPDSNRLAFIAQTMSGGLTLFVHDAASASRPNRVIDGGPLYLSWSHSSRYLLVHSHSSHYLVDYERGNEVVQMPGVSIPSTAGVGAAASLRRSARTGPPEGCTGRSIRRSWKVGRSTPRPIFSRELPRPALSSPGTLRSWPPFPRVSKWLLAAHRRGVCTESSRPCPI